jgi:hypothetical protein
MDKNSATVYIKRKGEDISVHIILTDFETMETAEEVALMLSDVIGLENILPSKRELH